MKRLAKLDITRAVKERIRQIQTYQNQFKRSIPNLKERLSKTAGSVSFKSPKVIGGLVALSLILGGIAVFASTTTSAVYIVINDERAGLVSSSEEGKNLVDSILIKDGQAVSQVAQTHDQVEYEAVRVKNSTFLNERATEEDVRSKLTYYVYGTELSIAGTPIAVLPSNEDLERLLKDYQDFYTEPSDTNTVNSVKFEEEYSSRQIETTPDQIKSVDEVLAILLAGQTNSQEYTVQAGDSWWLIARKNDMKTKDVLAGNPGATEDTVLHQGDKINLVDVQPYLTVTSEGVRTVTETIPFDVVTKTDFNLASGKSVIKEYGSDGSKKVTYSYVEKNGKVVSQEVVDEEVITKPVTQVVAKGPKQTTVSYVSRGSGQISGLIWPVSGRISSYYGYRWSGFHTGLDIAADRGDPFAASAAGTVVSAGWDGGYGKSILIDHGNGVMTRYAHATQLLVSSGQYVSKGQTIGLVGSTGNSTGPHLHFEVIINGDTVNPLSYLR